MQTQNQRRKDCVVAARIPAALKNLLQKYITLDTHINESDFLRDAIREKIQRDAPRLYRGLFEEASENGGK
jgi:hypothetical protein